MADSIKKLDQAIKNLIEAYSKVEEEFDEKYADDPETFETQLLETIESSIESAIDEQGSTTAIFASILSSFSEALEQLDPSAFEEVEDDDDYEIDDVDYEDLDEDDIGDDEDA